MFVNMDTVCIHMDTYINKRSTASGCSIALPFCSLLKKSMLPLTTWRPGECCHATCLCVTKKPFLNYLQRPGASWYRGSRGRSPPENVPLGTVHVCLDSMAWCHVWIVRIVTLNRRNTNLMFKCIHMASFWSWVAP